MNHRQIIAGLSLLAASLVSVVWAQEIAPVPSRVPNQAQREQIERKYGMFIHFGINTFHNQEWTDGSLPADSYAPRAIDARQWVETAKKAGMKYIILTAKHHEGFCLWDSNYTEYDVASSGDRTDVIEAVAAECKRQGIKLGLYYSLWDRKQNADVSDESLDAAYNRYMLNQLDELLAITGRHTDIVEFWFDGSWVKAGYRWPLAEIYHKIKSKSPKCQIGINWTIGQPDSPGDSAAEMNKHRIYPENQKEGDPIRYFPSDFRLGDPYLPAHPDPKLFSHQGKLYYMPWESTVCMSGKWFYHTGDKTWKTVEELEKLYRRATSQDNILILNAPPTRDGVLRQKDVNLLMELRQRLKL